MNTTGNRREEMQPCGFFDLCPVGIRYSAFGVGAIPISIRLESSELAHVSIGGYANGGGIWFTRRVPAETGTHFNFLAAYGADIGVRVSKRFWIEPGYRHLHLSNAGTGEVNAGLDTSLLVLGASWK